MRNFILYQDGSSDDYIALCLITAMLRKSGGKLAGIITAGTGEVDAKCGLQNVLEICNALGLEQIILGQGEDKRINPEFGQSFPSYIRSFIDTLPALIGLKSSPTIDKFPNAVESFHHIISQSDEPVVIIATGPLTDLDLLFANYPEDKKKVEIVMMGGAIHVPGNIQDLDPQIPNKVAEWNIFADIAAARNVIASGVPLLMVPLDVTQHIRVTENFYKQLEEIAQKQPTSAISLVYKLITALKVAFEKEHPEINFFQVYYLWDPFAAMIALEPAFAKIEEKYIQVVLETGKTEEVEQSAEGVGRIRVATDIAKPAEEILNHLIEIISSLPPPSNQNEKVTPWCAMFGSVNPQKTENAAQGEPYLQFHN
ncbi:nucleoside hydrolase [Legionella cardiaca]|uniref:Nucleoside hydrolase n=1 Tax=Legionella cardiaca TaxID=1071983 RepID=A0ABY8AUF4_9GAMM|nr:nucleoside hydrolase [Legionella cardiaca]WED44325.1 nucleoside hydrolase [Legionella cardiaca]